MVRLAGNRTLSVINLNATSPERLDLVALLFWGALPMSYKREMVPPAGIEPALPEYKTGSLPLRL